MATSSRINRKTVTKTANVVTVTGPPKKIGTMGTARNLPGMSAGHAKMARNNC